MQRICGVARRPGTGIYNFRFGPSSAIGDCFRPRASKTAVSHRLSSVSFPRGVVAPSGRGEDKTSDAILKFPHGGMFLMAPGGFLCGDDDKTLEALVAITEKHEIQLIL